jgi:hypothetical protein
MPDEDKVESQSADGAGTGSDSPPDSEAEVSVPSSAPAPKEPSTAIKDDDELKALLREQNELARQSLEVQKDTHAKTAHLHKALLEDDDEEGAKPPSHEGHEASIVPPDPPPQPSRDEGLPSSDDNVPKNSKRTGWKKAW